MDRAAEAFDRWPDLSAENLDDAECRDLFPSPEPDPNAFRHGMESAYMALVTGTAFLDIKSGEAAVLLGLGDAEARCAVGSEIAAARIWCEQMVASLRILEARTLTMAMSLDAKA